MRFTRREILTSFLGAPLAMAACRTVPSRFPDGEIVGANVSVGHLLRDFRGLEVPASNWESVGVVIIGGGVSGLSAAWRFEREGFKDYRVFELEPEPGGTARNGVGEPVPYPWGAHYLPVPFQENRELLALLTEMSLLEGYTSGGDPVVKEQYLCRDPEERLFYKGRWYDGLYLHAGESAEDRRQLAAFQAEIERWVAWRDSKGRRAFVLPVSACSDDAEATALDAMTFGEWLRLKGFTSERLLWYCDYATRDDYGLKADQTSAWAGLFYFCSRIRASQEESQPFITFPEGNGRFVSHLAAEAGERVVSNTLVMEMRPVTDGVEVVVLDAATKTLKGIRCRKAVFSAPLFTSRHIIRDFRDDPPRHLAEFQHNSWFVANLFLTDRPKGRSSRDFPMAWDNVLYESPSLGYVSATHQKGIDHGPTVLTYYHPMCSEEDGRAKLLALGWREMADIVLSDLGRAHRDISELTTRIDVMRWGHAMISPRPGFIWSGARALGAKPHRGIHFAHSDLSGIALFEEAFYHGNRAAMEVLASIRRN